MIEFRKTVDTKIQATGPVPVQGTRMRKILSLEDANQYHIGASSSTPKQVRGCVAKVEDVTIKNAAQVFDDFRLDYPDTKFAKDKGFATIEYDNNASDMVNAFENVNVKKYGPPQTQTGMLGSNSKIIPEYYHSYTGLTDGAILKFYNTDGTISKIDRATASKIKKLFELFNS